jgi:hypothetical protein
VQQRCVLCAACTVELCSLVNAHKQTSALPVHAYCACSLLLLLQLLCKHGHDHNSSIECSRHIVHEPMRYGVAVLCFKA